MNLAKPITLIVAVFLGMAALSEFTRLRADDALPTLIKKVSPTFVFIAGGSGAVISPDGEIITNHHVIADCRDATIGVTLGDGRVFDAAIIGRDRQGDLALLKIAGVNNLPFLPFADSASLRVGDFCLVMGNPLSLGMTDQTPSFSAGIISALHQFRNDYNDAIVIDAAVNPGNSGGPLLDGRGNLLGICGMTQTRLGLKSNTGVAFAIPSAQVKLWLPFLRSARGGNIFHGKIAGLTLREKDGKITVEKNRSIIPLKIGDIIIDFADCRVPTAARFASIEGMYPAGANLTMTVLRDNREERIEFVLPPSRPWKPDFTLAPVAIGDEFPKIAKVNEESAANAAGVLANDEIVAINEIPVNRDGIAQLARYLDNLRIGDEIALELRRGNAKFSAKFIAE